MGGILWVRPSRIRIATGLRLPAVALSESESHSKYQDLRPEDIRVPPPRRQPEMGNCSFPSRSEPFDGTTRYQRSWLTFSGRFMFEPRVCMRPGVEEPGTGVPPEPHRGIRQTPILRVARSSGIAAIAGDRLCRRFSTRLLRLRRGAFAGEPLQRQVVGGERSANAQAAAMVVSPAAIEASTFSWMGMNG